MLEERKSEEVSALASARVHRETIRQRLQDEDENELAALIEKCGQPLWIICAECGHQHQAEQRCRQKWCPVCVRAIATKRSLKYAAAVERLQWPLFITLTQKNQRDLDPENVRKMRRAFGKLRHRAWWKKAVRGGVAGMEVTNIGNGWHFHIHAVIDCRWLSAAPGTQLKPFDTRATIKRKMKLAADSVAVAWATCLQEPKAIVKVKRAYGSAAEKDSGGRSKPITMEVLKYSVKGSDLAEMKEEIGPLIWALKTTRLVTSFGSLFGKLRFPEEDRPKLACEKCGVSGAMMPAEVFHRQLDNDKRKKRR